MNRLFVKKSPVVAAQTSVNLGKFSCSVRQQERKLQVSAGGSGGLQGAEVVL